MLPENLVEIEDGEEIVASLVDEFFENAACIIAEKDLQQKVFPFTQQWVMAALVAAVNSQFMQTDDGDHLEGDAAGAWALDEEPVPSPVDTWATHSIPIRHKPRPPSPPEPKASPSILDAEKVRNEMLRRRSRQFKGRTGNSYSSAPSSTVQEATPDPEIRDQVQSAMSLAIPGEERETALKRSRSASVSIRPTDERSKDIQRGNRNEIKKRRGQTAKIKRDPRKPSSPKAKVKETQIEERKSEKSKSTLNNTSVVEKKKNDGLLNPVRAHGHEERELGAKTTLDEIRSQQSERELAAIARIARESKGSFAYDFMGKLIPVKKVDGDGLPKYSFQRKVSISTVTGDGGLGGDIAESRSDSKGSSTTSSRVMIRPPVRQQPPSIRKRNPNIRKVKVG